MRLDTIERRHKVVDDLVQRAFEIDQMFINDKENLDDWTSNIELEGDLVWLEKMVRGEQIFIYMIEEMDGFPSNSAEKKILTSIADNALNYYVESLLLPAIEYTHEALDTWKFKTAVGKRFHRNIDKKLRELIEKYRELYYLDQDDTTKPIEIKLDTSRDRFDTVMNFFNRGTVINDEFRDGEHQKIFSEIFGLMAILEKLSAIVDAIKTEILFENALNDMLDVKDESKRTSKKYLSPFAQSSETFMKNILIKRIELLISFTNQTFNNRRLMEFQTDLNAAMVALRKKYAEIYHI